MKIQKQQEIGAVPLLDEDDEDEVDELDPEDLLKLGDEEAPTLPDT